MKTRNIDIGLGGGRLIQLANRTPKQMMSYVIDTPTGELIVIDGGNRCPEDALNLYEMIRERGGRVSYWFLTHAHSDHIGALLYLMESDNFAIKIDNLAFNFPSEEWLATKEEWEINKRFLDTVSALGIHTVTPHAKDVFDIGGLRVEIVAEPVDYESYPQINPTSIILLVHFPCRSVLFLGDFDKSAQEAFLKHYDVSKLRCDVVQMAHHGQNAVDRSFYELIMPKICLYTAPLWLWENNKYMCSDPKTRGIGPFTTLETRRWMDELGATASYSLAEGDVIFS